MAIIIPSKNIYDKQINASKDNVFEAAEISAKQVGFRKENAENIATIEKNLTYSQNKSENYQTTPSLSVRNFTTSSFTAGVWRGVGAISNLFAKQYQEISVNIPQIYEDKYLHNIESNADEISVTLIGNLYGGTASSTVDFTLSGDTMTLNNEPSIQYDGLNLIQDNVEYNFPLQIEHSVNGSNIGDETLTVTSKLSDLPISIQYISLTKNETIFTLKFSTYLSWIQAKLGFENYLTTISGEGYVANQVEDGYVQGQKGITFSGECFEYRPTKIKVSVNGYVTYLLIEDKTERVGSSTTKNVLSFSGNELMQVENYYLNTDGTRDKAISKAFFKTVQEYKDGKEIITLLCSIDNYYDENGNKVVSIDNSNKMTIEIGDIIKPMRFTAKGQDEPINEYQVIGWNLFYDGAVWQEITAQEK